MNHLFTHDFVALCKSILAVGKSVSEWALVESDDMFQVGPYEGGFDAGEAEFCFEVIIDGDEFWFQVPLEQITQIASGALISVDVRPAE